MMREMHPLEDMRSLVELYRFFRHRHFDVVHTHTVKAGLLGPLAAQLAGVPVVLHTVHGLLFHDEMPRAKRSLFWLAEKFTSSFTDCLLSQSLEDVDVAVRSRLCAPGTINYLGNGIDVQLFSPLSTIESREITRRSFGFGTASFVIGTVARLVYEKGLAELFEAAERLTSLHPEVRFLVIGPQETDQNDGVPATQIASMNRRGAVVFAGWRSDMPACYAAMDAFLLPSHREGIPRACMEASAMELPVIASDIRGCREVVLHCKTGLLVPVRDVDAIVAAVEELLANGSRATAMGRRGRRHIVENHDHRNVLARLCAFYAALDREHTVRNAQREPPQLDLHDLCSTQIPGQTLRKRSSTNVRGR
jgi:glycosyltransferase involved in cell wall biosynthesis